ncbi:hypothetical protein ABIB40_001189 [Pedobacter sp. UYP30]|uniref:fumarate hydratase n=1 Tax=Pedobacter sp. UYP30 TaxID=1756400 RepID=UPI003393F7E4
MQYLLRPKRSNQFVVNKRRVFTALAIWLCIGLFASCVRRPNIQGKGTVFMQGVWNEDSVAFSSRLKTFTQHGFKFTCDSFYVDLTTHSKVNFYEDSCFNNGLWKEYAKGVYAVKNDTLSLSGTFTHANYKQKLSGCYRIGRYERIFLIKKADSSVIILESTTDQREIRLNLKQKIICVQKSL